jgi:RES domain-containing protein
LIVHRLTRAPFARLDGEGPRLYGGRWTSPGLPAVYTAASPSLAVLKVLVHLDLPPELMPRDYRLLTIALPDDAPTERLSQRRRTAAARLSLGDRFLRSGQALALLVPSVVVPQEENAILNARHPAMSHVRVLGNIPFRFDRRLLDPTAR